MCDHKAFHKGNTGAKVKMLVSVNGEQVMEWTSSGETAGYEFIPIVSTRVNLIELRGILAPTEWIGISEVKLAGWMALGRGWGGGGTGCEEGRPKFRSISRVKRYLARTLECFSGYVRRLVASPGRVNKMWCLGCTRVLGLPRSLDCGAVRISLTLYVSP